ncbi:MAG: A/G-specific adenine glycosylase [Pirellulaceae bacterium]|nr:A/G-specific adenine glycosylase [Pirellulaceae bacterium]
MAASDRPIRERHRPRAPATPAHRLTEAADQRHFRAALLRWYRRHARPLPWRPSPGLYATWISEVMLQQTQVATVIPYYRRFLAQFPDVQSLASAQEADVLRCWEGLGYYRRARQLHAAARRIVRDYEGLLPTRFDQWCALPGIGRYTAGAILSIALDQRHPILEANTQRLLSRLLALAGDPTSAAHRRLLWSWAALLLPRRACGDFNQALMELGSTVCTPRAPQCARCPVARHCAALAQGRQAELPGPQTPVAYVERQEVAVVVRRADGRVLVRQCGEGERWAGLWDFLRLRLDHDTLTARALCAGVHALSGVRVGPPRELAVLRHGVTRHRITLRCYAADCRRAGRRRAGVQWVTPAELGRLPVSVTTRQISRLIEP